MQGWVCPGVWLSGADSQVGRDLLSLGQPTWALPSVLGPPDPPLPAARPHLGKQDQRAKHVGGKGESLIASTLK